MDAGVRPKRFRRLPFRHMRQVLNMHEHQCNKSTPNRAHRNTSKLAKYQLSFAEIVQSCKKPAISSVTSDIGHQTDTQTEIHTFFIWYPRVGREHNSPSGNNFGTRFLYFYEVFVIIQSIAN